MKLRKFIAVFLAGIAVQAAIYLYLDQVLFVPPIWKSDVGANKTWSR